MRENCFMSYIRYKNRINKKTAPLSNNDQHRKRRDICNSKKRNITKIFEYYNTMLQNKLYFTL